MIKRYEERELIELWKVKRGLLPSPSTGELEQYTPLDARIAIEIREWYNNLLLTADSRYLPVEDVASESESEYVSDSGMDVTVPSRAVRFVELKMPEWRVGRRLLNSPADDLSLLQGFALAAGSVEQPVIVDMWPTLHVHGVKARKTEISGEITDKPAESDESAVPVTYSVGDETIPAYAPPVIERLLCVVRPETGIYLFDEILLETERRTKR